MRKRSISKLKLHSIPILHKSKCLRYVSYSIPLMCSLALLLLLSNLFIISSNNKTYATEDISNSSNNGNSGISTYATISVNPTATLTIENSHLDTIASPGTVNYVSSKVDISASDITGYSLILSGPESLSGSTPITGAGGKNPNDMANNSWGYAWTNGEASDTTAYNTLSPSGSNIKESANDTKVTNFNVNFSRQLTFAAKFAEDATSGHYKANVTLSLAATPREVATGFNGIYDMQDMTTSICKSAQKGLIGSLEDTRDGNVYTVAKLDDDNCWMTRNLSLALWDEENNTPITLTPEDSNVKEDWVSTTGKSEVWNDSSCANTPNSADCNIIKYYNPENSGKSQDPLMGHLYTWNAAVVGTGSEIEQVGQNAGQDICPKGWELPTGGNGGQYQQLTSAINAPNDATGSTKLQSSPYDFPNPEAVLNIWNGILGENYEYWSRTNDTEGTLGAYTLLLSSSSVLPRDTSFRSRGRMLRCIAKDDDTRTLNDITTMQEVTPKICENTPQYTVNQKEYTLTDARDGKTYTVAKLDDNKCWMTQTLALALWDEEKNQAITLTPDDSDIRANWQSPTGPSAIWPETDASSCEASTYTPEACNIARYYNGSETSNWKEEYGYYYSWGSATAGQSIDIEKGVATQSICPKGWRLPLNGVNGDFGQLFAITNITSDEAGLTKLVNAPYNAVMSGEIIDRKLNGIGTFTSYLCSNASDERGVPTIAYNYNPNKTVFNYNISTGGLRSRGRTIRCIAY